MDKNVAVKPNPKIVFSQEDDVGLLFNPDNGRISTLNSTAKLIWSLLDGKRSTEELSRDLAAQFDAPDLSSLRRDTQVFIDRLGKAGFIQGYKERPFASVSVCLGITSKCNLSCKHCLNRGLPHQEPDMTTEKLLQVIDELKELGAGGVSLFGGEPLMHPDFKKIVSYLREKKMAIALNTNGTLIDKDMASYLKTQGVRLAVVSFDGSKASITDSIRGQGVFEKSLEGIKALHSEGIRTVLSVTINKINHKDLRGMVLLGKKI
jgi:sulfatase maturation enzyme AslB (radical SAM superfamily)